jgi:hypothetical protein
MTIQERLAAFDGWLTHRIEEAYAASKDLAFRELAADGAVAEPWEYSLLDPGQVSPAGEGWSVYRLQGIWPEFLADSAFVEQFAPHAS